MSVLALSRTAPYVIVMDETPSNVTAAVTLDATRLAKLAHELVWNIAERPVIFARFGLTEAQFAEHVENKPFFKQAYESAVIEWESAKSTSQRIQLKSAIQLEESLPVLHQRMNDDKEALSGVVETAKLLAKISGVDGTSKTQTGTGEKFVININLGAAGGPVISHEKTLERFEVRGIEEGAEARPALLPVPEGPAVHLPVQPRSTPPSNSTEVQPISEGSAETKEA